MGKSKKKAKTTRSKIANWMYVIGFTFLVLAGVALICKSAGEIVGPAWQSVRSIWAKTEIPALTGRVVDVAKVLKPDGVAKVTDEILQLEAATKGGQMAVLTVPTLNSQPIEDFSLKVAEKWGIGQKGRDNGAVLVIAVGDHKDRLEVGYGWEGPINDAKAGDILREMMPYLQADDYAGAMILAVRRVKGFVTGDVAVEMPAVVPSGKSENGANPFVNWIGWLFGLGFANIILAALLDPSKSSGSGGRSSGGGFFGGGGGGGGFSGGGGSFGGGGASGHW
jgi:uncharacterized protein